MLKKMLLIISILLSSYSTLALSSISYDSKDEIVDSSIAAAVKIQQVRKFFKRAVKSDQSIKSFLSLCYHGGIVDDSIQSMLFSARTSFLARIFLKKKDATDNLQILARYEYFFEKMCKEDLTLLKDNEARTHFYSKEIELLTSELNELSSKLE